VAGSAWRAVAADFCSGLLGKACFGSDLALGAFRFVVDVFAGFLAAFFATVLADFFASLFAAFLALFRPRFFAAAGLAAPRFAAVLAFFFFEDFLATTKSLNEPERDCWER
jgi:hypothetical protein